MSTSKSKKDGQPKVVDQHAPVHTQTMSRGKRAMILAVSIFCLLIFSVTGPMSDVFAQWMGGGPPLIGVVDLPSGEHDIDQNEYRRAAINMEWEGRLLGRTTMPDDDTESVLAYATLMLLADEMEVAVSDAQLQAQLAPFAQAGAEAYRNFFRGYNFPSALAFESQVRQLLRVQAVLSLLSTAAVASEEDALSQWQEDHEEMRVAYTVFFPSAFADKVTTLEATEEELLELYDNGLTPIQRADLEKEQAVAFQTVVLTAEDLDAEAVQAWFQPEEPSEEALNGFYNSNKFTLYRRPEPEDGQEVATELGMHLTAEELGDRLRRDYLLNKAINELAFDLPAAEDVAAFAAERGATFLDFPEPVAISGLMDLEAVGHISLRRLFQGEDTIWMPNPVQLEDSAYLMRPMSRTERELPALADIRGDLMTIWREGKQQEMAEEAAQSFVDALPRAEGALEGDPAVLSAEEFTAAASAAGQAMEDMGWVSRRARPAADPDWPMDATILRGLRARIGGSLQDLLDGEVIGPEDFGEDGIAVAQMIERRSPEVSSMWPMERDRALMMNQYMSQQRFMSDLVSFEGLSRAYNLRKLGE